MDAQRVIDSDAAAQQRRCLLAFQALGDGNHKARIGANSVCVSAVAMNAGALRLGAKIFKPFKHHSHMPQEFDCQPRPTRCPTSLN